jgi:hypothetical protein
MIKTENYFEPRQSKQIISLSHNDLDGVSAQILLNTYFKNTSLHTCNYSETLDQLKQIKKQLHLFDIFFITDLVIDEDIYNYVSQLLTTFPKLTIFWIDHHYQSENWINKSLAVNYTNIFNIDKSATKLLSELLNINSKYIDSINAFDIWDTTNNDFKLGMVYNSLFWNYKPRSFYSQFKNSQELTDRHKEDFTKINKSKNDYFSELEQKGLVLKNENLTVIFGDLHQNWVQLQYPGIFTVQVFSFGKIVVKIDRSINEDVCINISNEILSSINNDLLLNSGGHHHILSLTHSGDKDYNVIIDYTKIIFNVLKNIKY